MRTRMILLALAVAVSLTACSAPPKDSGVQGAVTIGPTSPVQKQGESGEAPYEATIAVVNSSGATVAEVQSSADGRFSVNLAPGRYTLVPQSPGSLPRADPYDVTVEPHAFTEVSIQYDSGIR